MVIDCTIIRRYVHDYCVSHGGIGLQLLHHRSFVRSFSQSCIMQQCVRKATADSPCIDWYFCEMVTQLQQLIPSVARRHISTTLSPALLSFPTSSRRNIKAQERHRAFSSPSDSSCQTWASKRLRPLDKLTTIKKTYFLFENKDFQDCAFFMFTHFNTKNWKHKTVKFIFKQESPPAWKRKRRTARAVNCPWYVPVLAKGRGGKRYPCPRIWLGYATPVLVLAGGRGFPYPGPGSGGGGQGVPLS